VKPTPTSFSQLLNVLTEERQPSAEALSFYREGRLSRRESYGSIVARARSVRSVLVNGYGLRVGDRLAILSPNADYLVPILLGALSAGIVIVPLNPSGSAEDWHYILQHSGASMLLATSSLQNNIEGAGFWHGITANFESLENAPASPPFVHHASPDLPAVILYTSGTTGFPKGVVLTQSALLQNAAWMVSRLALEHPVHLVALPLCHAHALGVGCLSTFIAGGRMVLMETFNPFAWPQLIAEEGVTFSSVVPHMLPALRRIGVRAERLPSLRGLLVSSAPLAPGDARTFEEDTGIPLFQGWGQSEFTNFATCMPTSLDTRERQQLLWQGQHSSVGTPLPGVEVRVVAPDGMPLGEGLEGELWLRGGTRMLAYHQSDAETARALEGDWLKTGDLGYFSTNAQGQQFFISGRIKEIIIRGADKLSPTALERKLAARIEELEPGSYAIVGYPDSNHGEEVGLVVHGEESVRLRELLHRASAWLALPERPKRIVFVPNPLPRTHTGKLRRQSLRTLFIDAPLDNSATRAH
jgi:acyl-CoA synthetase (AMP-forming)/AMP-acid ligase II